MTLRILFICLIFTVAITFAQNTVLDTHYTTFQEMQPAFENPPADFRPAPFWVWHDKLDKEMLERDLEDFKEIGMGGGFIHPRYGLITEYLSDEWFDRVEFSVKKSKALGLKMWIYDENSFPSGFAGGWVPELLPESANQPTGLTMERVSEIPDADIAVVLQKTEHGFKDVTESVSAGDNGDYIILKNHYYDKSKWFGGRSYVDLLIPGVTETFIEVTMSGYEERVCEYFGDLVPGVFTDEPNISPRGRGAMRFTPALFAEFEKRWGYDLTPHLPSIFEEVGDWKRVRHNYYELLLELFIEHWSKPWYEYTEEKNLAWTGHYWEHGWPSPVHGGDNMAMYAYHQVPAIDMLFNSRSERPDQFGNIRAVKELSSIANQFGRVRALSETYGASGWELTFEDMKRNGDWEYVLGVNFMNQHLAYMNLTGDRKHDFPQGISYQTPWWDDYRPLNDYFARLSVALSSGFQINDILILEPTTTTWMYYSPTESHEKLETIGDAFHDVLAELETFQIEYDLGSENTIKDFASVEEDKFVINKRAYSTVVLPPYHENLDARTFALLQQFLDQGGSVFCVGETPKFIDGQASEKLTSLVNNTNWRNASTAELIDQLAKSAFELREPTTVGGELFHMRRELGDGQVVFLCNFSQDDYSRGTFSMNGASVRALDPFTGESKPHPAASSNGRITASFDLPPAGSLLLFVDPRQTPPLPPQPKPQPQVVSAEPSTIKRSSPNFLTLDYMDLKIGDEQYENMYFYTGGFKIWQAHGYPDNPWVSSVQWKSEWVEADTFGTGSGFEARFPFTVEAGVDLSSLKAVVENPNLWQVQINGKTVKPIPGEWAIDETWGVFDISQHMQVGENEIAILMFPMSIYAEIEPVYVIGNFDLESQEQGWKLVPQTDLRLGSWKEQGLPFYAYDVEYSKTVSGLNNQKIKVKLNDWHGTVASVHVNGKKAGIIGWPPYELDISEFVGSGENKINVRVTGSFKNLLGPHHNVTRRGIVTPWSFKYAPEEQPAGNEYDLLDYGLFEDFSVLAY